MSLDVEIYPPVNGNHYVVVGGRLDSSTHEELDAKLAPLLAQGPASRVLVLDLARLEYISSAGVRSILKARKALAPHDGKVLVVNPQAQIHKVLELVQALPMNEVFASTAEADAYLDALQREMLHGKDEG